MSVSRAAVDSSSAQTDANLRAPRVSWHVFVRDLTLLSVISILPLLGPGFSPEALTIGILRSALVCETFPTPLFGCLNNESGGSNWFNNIFEALVN